jgi:hypothetical protein
MHKVFTAGADAIRQSIATLEVQAFEKAVEVLRTAHTVLFVGVGTSAPLAQDAAYRFRTIGVHAESPLDVHVQHVSASLLTRRDVCVAVSHTGATRETLACVKSAAARRALCGCSDGHAGAGDGGTGCHRRGTVRSPFLGWHDVRRIHPLLQLLRRLVRLIPLHRPQHLSRDAGVCVLLRKV